jgi:hypothetical protein
MADGTCSFYTRWSQGEFNPAELESVMSRFGASLFFPGTKDVVTLTQDGEQQRCDRVEFVRQVRSHESTSFQWWINDGEDVYCRLRWVGISCVVEFGLDGMDALQIRRFIECIISYANEVADSRGFLGLVAEFGIDAGGYDWDTYFLKGGFLTASFPAILGLPIERDCDVPPTYKHVRRIGNSFFYFNNAFDFLELFLPF